MQKQLPLPKFTQQPQDYYRKVLLWPRLSDATFSSLFLFLQRKLHVHNCGIYLVNQKKMYCHVWNEYVASTTADEMISVLWEFFQQNIENRYSDWKLWSDNCVAQNFCWKLLFFYAFLIKTKKVRVFPSGHVSQTRPVVSFMLNFAAKESQCKSITPWTHIYTVRCFLWSY